MTQSTLEHTNITVKNAKQSAQILCKIFDWKIRWSGDAIDGGTSYHIGGDASYLALYTPVKIGAPGKSSYITPAGLNHLGIIVEDIEKVEARIIEAGYEPHSHADYEPGRRFYFREENGIEIEVVSYQ